MQQMLQIFNSLRSSTMKKAFGGSFGDNSQTLVKRLNFPSSFLEGHYDVLLPLLNTSQEYNIFPNENLSQREISCRNKVGCPIEIKKRRRKISDKSKLQKVANLYCKIHLRKEKHILKRYRDSHPEMNWEAVTCYSYLYLQAHREAVARYTVLHHDMNFEALRRKRSRGKLQFKIKTLENITRALTKKKMGDWKQKKL